MKHSTPRFVLALGLSGLLAAGLATPRAAESVPPQIANIRVAQRPATMLVDIWYDLIDPDSPFVMVGFQFSADGGATYSIPANHLSGDAGVVAPGRDRHAV
ncbi:MAG: hypothetical protein FJ387_24475 [Verrucomicrobia bacterium]|nr:hypothetical protein [Verrucomicrobiota bacterium]